MAITTYKKGSREYLAPNFQAFEFDCNCSRCTETPVDDRLPVILQKISDNFGNKPVHITGPYRCPEHNAEIKNASPTSLHMYGKAVDIWIEDVAPAEVAKFAESIGVKGIGLYEARDCGDDFVHIDTRTRKSFWYGHKQAYRSTFGGAPEEPKEERKTYTMQLSRLEMGCKGEDVKPLQILLNGKGYSCGQYGADGDFGKATRTAVVRFQEDHRLTGDGIVGPATWKALLDI